METKIVTVHLRAITKELPMMEFEIPSVVKLLSEGYSIKEIKQIPYDGGGVTALLTTVIFIFEKKSAVESAAENA